MIVARPAGTYRWQSCLPSLPSTQLSFYRQIPHKAQLNRGELHCWAKKTMRAVVTLFVITCLFFCGCTNDEALRASTEKDLRASLARGDSRQKIEQVLREKNLTFSFDDFARRFQIRFDPKEKRSDQRVIMIYIYVDDAMRFKDVEVRNSYTVL